MQIHKYHFKFPNLKLLATSLIFLLSNISTVSAAFANSVEMSDPNMVCTDLKIIFARGSGSQIHATNYQVFEQAFIDTFADSGLSLSFYELGSSSYGGYSYPSPGIGIYTWQRFTTSLGALFSGGGAYSYGKSVEEGSNEARVYINRLLSVCPNTKIIMGGYSQGAQTVSRTLQKIQPSQIYQALTFGDPKLYLPEGKYSSLSKTTLACQNGVSSHSVYRTYVPDCHTYEGILGGYNPYQPSSDYNGKVKTYCQWHDVICSSYIEIGNLAYGHATYKEQGTYKRAAEDVYRELAEDGIGNLSAGKYTVPVQNVAIMFDVTGSMRSFLGKYQNEAITAANNVLKNGGKVALYTYGDMYEGQDLTEICDFSTCNSDNIKGYIMNLTVTGGGDDPESVLSSAYSLMHRASFEVGANKSIVVISDASYHDPDKDHITIDDVTKLALDLDPVNFYILTTEEVAPSYSELAAATDGAVFTSNLSDVFDTIDSHQIATSYDYNQALTVATYSIDNMTYEVLSDSSVRISYDTDAPKIALTLDDFIAGYTEEHSVEIVDLDLSEGLRICASPLAMNFRGSPVCVDVPATASTSVSANAVPATATTVSSVIIPRAPNTGRQ